MSSRRPGGFTLVEMVIAIVIISVGLAGVLLAFNTAVKSSADPLVQKQMLAIAEEMMEEILLKPYATASGTISGCNRASADDVRDYAAYDQAVCSIDGTAIPELSGYNVAVAVTSESWQGVTGTLHVKVSVTHGSESLSLDGWRTAYACESGVPGCP